jgi:hypothetical protein
MRAMMEAMIGAMMWGYDGGLCWEVVMDNFTGGGA